MSRLSYTGFELLPGRNQNRVIVLLLRGEFDEGSGLNFVVDEGGGVGQLGSWAVGQLGTYKIRGIPIQVAEVYFKLIDGRSGISGVLVV